MVGQSVEQCGRHFGITEHRRPLTEGQVRRDDDRGALVESADQVEQELTSGLSELEIAEFIENNEVEACKGNPPFDLVYRCVSSFPGD